MSKKKKMGFEVKIRTHTSSFELNIHLFDTNCGSAAAVTYIAMTMFLTIVLAIASSALATKDYSNLVFQEDFSKGIDFSLWKHEIVSCVACLKQFI